MAIAFVQSLGTPTSATTTAATLTLTTSAVVASGDTIIVAAACGRGTVPTTATFSGGGLTWSTTIFASRAASVLAVAIGIAQAPSGLASGTVITVTWDQSTTRRGMALLEFSPLSSSDVSTSSSNASGSNITGTTGTTAQADELAIGVWSMLESVAGTSGTPGTNSGTATGGTVTEFMDLGLGSATEAQLYAEYQILTGVGTANLNFTPSTAGANIGAIATFKGAAAGGSTTPLIQSIVVQQRAAARPRRHGYIIENRPMALAVPVTPATVVPPHIFMVEAHTPRSQRHGGVILPLASQRGVASLALEALVTPPHQYIIEAHPRTVQHHGSVIEPRPQGLIFTPAGVTVTPPHQYIILAHTPGQHRDGNVIAPRPAGLIFTPVVGLPRTVHVIEAIGAQVPRQHRHGQVLEPRPQGLIFTPIVVPGLPRTMHVLIAHPPRQHTHGLVVVLHGPNLIGKPVPAPVPANDLLDPTFMIGRMFR